MESVYDILYHRQEKDLDSCELDENNKTPLGKFPASKFVSQAGNVSFADCLDHIHSSSILPLLSLR